MSKKDNTITRAKLLELGGAADANYAVLDGLGELYLSLHLTHDFSPTEEEAYWESQSYTLKKVIL